MRHNNPHFSFLAATLAGSQPHARALLRSPSWNDEEVIRTASDETVLAPLYGQLAHLGLTQALRPGVSDFLSAYRDLNRERNRQILSELEDIAWDLNRIGIQPIVLKGLAYLLTGVYADPADRFLLDIDLLVVSGTETDTAAWDVLLGRGYTPEHRQATALARDYHFPPLFHPERIKIELHRDLGHGISAQILSPQGIWDRSTPFPLGRAVVRVPSPADLVAHLVVHSQLHHGYDQRIWPPLRAMYDLLLLTRHFAEILDYSEIRAVFHRHRQATILDLHLLQTAEVLAMPLPYKIQLSPWATLRWFHRRILWRWPWLSRFDPLYLFNSLIAWRMRLLPRLLHTPAGRRHLLAAPFRWSFYRNLLAALQR